MSQTTGSLRDPVLSRNEEYRQLQDQHQEYETRLNALAGKVVLTDDEQLEETTLKKKKLSLRDRMEAIARLARETEH
jgi:hypothetical protein